MMSTYALLHPLAAAVQQAAAFPSVPEAPAVVAVKLAAAVALLTVVAASETAAVVVLAKRRPLYLVVVRAALAATVATPLDSEAVPVCATQGLTVNCTASFLACNYDKTATPDPAVVPAAAVDAVHSPKYEPNAGKTWA